VFIERKNCLKNWSRPLPDSDRNLDPDLDPDRNPPPLTLSSNSLHKTHDDAATSKSRMMSRIRIRIKNCFKNGSRPRKHFVRRESPDPAVRPTGGLQVTRQRSEKAVAEDGRVRRPCPNQPGGASPGSPRSDSAMPCLVPHTGNGAVVVRGLVSTRRRSEASGTNAPFRPGACATNLRFARPFGSWPNGGR